MLAVVALIIAGAAALSHSAPFPFVFEAFRPKKSIWRVQTASAAPAAIYLTFDDGPNPAWTPALLDALGREGVRATFFLIDDHITDETAPILLRMAAEGHAMALHSGSRRPMVMSPPELATELEAAATRIRTLSGVEPCRLFRPHAGWRSAAMYQALDRIGYQLAGWSWGMWDWDWWRRPDGSRVAQRLARKASPGDIIVVHDGHHANPRADRRHAPEVVRLLAPLLRARGFDFAPLCGPSAGTDLD